MSLISLEGLSTADWIWGKLPIAVGSKLTSGQIDGDGGDRVVMRLSLLQHGAYSQAAERSIEHSRMLSPRQVQTQLSINSANPIFSSVDAAVRVPPGAHKTPSFPVRRNLFMPATHGSLCLNAR